MNTNKEMSFYEFVKKFGYFPLGEFKFIGNMLNDNNFPTKGSLQEVETYLTTTNGNYRIDSFYRLKEKYEYFLEN